MRRPVVEFRQMWSFSTGRQARFSMARGRGISAWGTCSVLLKIVNRQRTDQKALQAPGPQRSGPALAHASIVTQQEVDTHKSCNTLSDTLHLPHIAKA